MGRRLLPALLALMLVCSCALAEDEEISITDTSGLIIEEFYFGDVLWDFPIDLADMDPEMIRLANKHVFLPSDFVPSPLVTMKTRKTDSSGNNTNGGVNKASSSEMQLQQECAEHLVEMFEAALDDGISLYLKSAYRSYRTQKTMYYNRLQSNGGKDDGWVTKPGASDHQTGLGCDVVPRSWRDKSMNEKMASDEACVWMAEHCHEFGFILRYPEDKQDITEINYEPWHMRYVGNPAATYIMKNGLCLEEFQEQLQSAIEKFLNAGGHRSMVEAFIQVSAEEE
ncbi:MAG: M15 family metallopeptidase [Christensenellaceae bacterium]|nr:M15 family metallopeptidase [Christensenellaceae bacterium]